MGKVKATPGAVALFAAFMAMQTMEGCGESTRSPQPADTPAEGGSGGAQSAGGSSAASAGFGADGGAGEAGQAGAGSGLGRGGSTFGGGGGTEGQRGGETNNGGGLALGGSDAAPSSCREGVPCACEDRLGTIECNGDRPSCVCPAPDACKSPESTSCFEPCGGDPTGGWVLEESCFPTSTTDSGSGCQRVFAATPGANELRIRLGESGRMDFSGMEEWSVNVTTSLSCLSIDSVKDCDTASLRANPFAFAISGNVVGCKENPCGVCDCGGKVRGDPSITLGWQSEGDLLWFGSTALPYCVEGDTLWLGGSTPNVPPTAAYKLKKRSCEGKPLACEARSEAQCEQGRGCTLGRCKKVSDTTFDCASTSSEPECNLFEGCGWIANECWGSAPANCEFLSCGVEPGCSFGAPRARCGGTPEENCYNRELARCAGDGCSIRVCGNSGSASDCTLLNATECARAPGCTVTSPGSAKPCSGVPECLDVNDTALCRKLQCSLERNCWGELSCSTRSVANCHEMPGCVIEW